MLHLSKYQGARIYEPAMILVTLLNSLGNLSFSLQGLWELFVKKKKESPYRHDKIHWQWVWYLARATCCLRLNLKIHNESWTHLPLWLVSKCLTLYQWINGWPLLRFTFLWCFREMNQQIPSGNYLLLINISKLRNFQKLVNLVFPSSIFNLITWIETIKISLQEFFFKKTLKR